MPDSRFLSSDLRDRFEGAARYLRGLGRAIPEHGDVPDLLLLQALRDDVDAAMAEAVAGLRALGTPEHPVTWALIASGLGVTEQAVRKRWR